MKAVGRLSKADMLKQGLVFGEAASVPHMKKQSARRVVRRKIRELSRLAEGKD